jgi:hypothetical protein
MRISQSRSVSIHQNFFFLSHGDFYQFTDIAHDRYTHDNLNLTIESLLKVGIIVKKVIGRADSLSYSRNLHHDL